MNRQETRSPEERSSPKAICLSVLISQPAPRNMPFSTSLIVTPSSDSRVSGAPCMTALPLSSKNSRQIDSSAQNSPPLGIIQSRGKSALRDHPYPLASKQCF
jgi:hypothetical protein